MTISPTFATKSILFWVFSLAALIPAFSQRNDNVPKFEPNEKPNVVLFLADDLGYGDLSCYGNDKVLTPNIDSLARDGVRFTRMYSQPVCSPSRAAIMTGSYPVRHGFMGDTMAMFGVNWPVFRSHAQPGGLNCKARNLLSHLFMMKNYARGFIGKWHLGYGKENLPRPCGFEYFYGTPGSHCAGCAGDKRYRLTDHEIFVRVVSDQIVTWSAIFALLLSGVYMGFIGKRSLILACVVCGTWLLFYRCFLFLLHDNPMSCILMRNDTIIEQPYTDENMTLRMTSEALQFVSKSATAKTPFFLFMSYLQPHVPSFRSSRFANESGHGHYYDSVLEIDWSIGVIRSRIEELGLGENTLLIFASDNGPELTNPIVHVKNPSNMQGSTVYKSLGDSDQPRVTLRGEKGSVWEGGIRVPAIMSWPGHIKPGTQSSSLTSLMDIFPTVMDILDIKEMNRFVDGKSLISLLTNPSLDDHHELLLHFCDMHVIAAVSYGDYKIHFSTGSNNYSCHGVMLQPPLVFNVVKDPGETTPLPVNQYERLLNKVHMEVIKRQTNILTKSVTQASHFSQLPRPWLFPCSNFPFCQTSISDENFDHLPNLDK